MQVFKKLNIEFDYAQLRKDVVSTFENIRDKAHGTEYHVLATRNQCLTVSQPNSEDWLDGVAGKTIQNKTRELNHITAKLDETNEIVDETRFIHPIKQIQGTYLEKFIQGFTDVYRWRISVLPPRTTLSIHKDGSPMMQTFNMGSAVLDWRLHFPITTNNRCFLVNWPDDFTGVSDEGQDISLQIAHFKAGSGYLLNTSKTHCATNYSDKERIHLIASVRDITQVS